MEESCTNDKKYTDMLFVDINVKIGAPLMYEIILRNKKKNINLTTYSQARSPVVLVVVVLA